MECRNKENSSVIGSYYPTPEAPPLPGLHPEYEEMQQLKEKLAIIAEHRQANKLAESETQTYRCWSPEEYAVAITIDTLRNVPDHLLLWELELLKGDFDAYLSDMREQDKKFEPANEASEKLSEYFEQHASVIPALTSAAEKIHSKVQRMNELLKTCVAIPEAALSVIDQLKDVTLSAESEDENKLRGFRLDAVSDPDYIHNGPLSRQQLLPVAFHRRKKTARAGYETTDETLVILQQMTPEANLNSETQNFIRNHLCSIYDLFRDIDDDLHQKDRTLFIP